MWQQLCSTFLGAATTAAVRRVEGIETSGSVVTCLQALSLRARVVMDRGTQDYSTIRNDVLQGLAHIGLDGVSKFLEANSTVDREEAAAN